MDEFIVMQCYDPNRDLCGQTHIQIIGENNNGLAWAISEN